MDKFRAKEQIAIDYPFVTEKAKEIRETFGIYSGLTIWDDGERVYSWERKQAYVVPTNTILDRNGNYKQPPKGTFWNGHLKKPKGVQPAVKEPIGPRTNRRKGFGRSSD